VIEAVAGPPVSLRSWRLSSVFVTGPLPRPSKYHPHARVVSPRALAFSSDLATAGARRRPAFRSRETAPPSVAIWYATFTEATSVGPTVRAHRVSLRRSRRRMSIVSNRFAFEICRRGLGQFLGEGPRALVRGATVVRGRNTKRCETTSARAA